MMDDFEKKLYNIRNKAPEAPNSFTKKIEETINIYEFKQKIKKYSLSKIIATSCASIVAATGMVFAGTMLSEHIWKTPEKTIGFYGEQNKNSITNEDKNGAITEDEAREEVEMLLKRFGYENEKIKTIELQSTPKDYELYWDINTNSNISIRLNANNTKNFSIGFGTPDGIENYRTTKEKIINTAKTLVKKYGYDVEKYTDIKVMGNIEQDNNEDFTYSNSYIYIVVFYKEYDGLINPYESIHITFVPEINEIISFAVYDQEYENNEIKITEEQAKKIAIEAEQKTKPKYNIKNIYIDLKIAQMNGNAYLRMTDYEQYCEQNWADYSPNEKIDYRTENRTRKVLAVTIEYEIPENSLFYSYDYADAEKYYTYFIDVTSGEIIGGDSPFVYKK